MASELLASHDPRAQSPAQAQAPWRARLELQFARTRARTVLARQQHEGPLLVQRLLYPEPPTAGPCHAYVLHPPGGVVSGDQLELVVHLAPQAQVLLTTAAAGKFYRSPDAYRAGEVIQRFEVAEGELEWLPFENIFYPSSVVELHTLVDLTRQSRFIGWEIGCLGLPARNLGLQGGQMRQSIELRCAGRPLLLERTHLDSTCAAARWGLQGRAAFGSWLAYPAGPQQLELARAVAASTGNELTLGCSLVDEVLCCRASAWRADQLRQSFIELWRALRPALLGRAAHLPRIWMT